MRVGKATLKDWRIAIAAACTVAAAHSSRNQVFAHIDGTGLFAWATATAAANAHVNFHVI
jgi:hypothetical protein